MSDASVQQWRSQVFVAAGNVLGESPLWDQRTGTIYWLDLLKPTLNSVSFDGANFQQVELRMPPPLGMIALSDNPGILYLTGRGGLHLLDASDGSVQPLGDPTDGQADIVFNDGKKDRSGRLWLGTSHEFETQPKGALYLQLDDGSFSRADQGFAVSNGPAFSRDGSVLYFSDSVRSRILAYDLPAAGVPLKNRRVFATFTDGEGVPDGLTVDAEDCVWCAHWGGAHVSRLTPDGKRIGRVDLPVPLVTSCTFAGPGLETLVITTAKSPAPIPGDAMPIGEGDLFSCRPGVRGFS